MNKSQRFLGSAWLLLGALGAGCGAVADAGQDTASQKLLQTIANGDPFGSVTSQPAGIQCGTQCGYLFDVGTQVTLTAAPDSGWDFAGWQGACSGAALTCSVTMSDSQQVYFSFKRQVVNDSPPVAVNDAATVAEDSGATAINVLANDTDSDGGPKLVGSVTQPQNGAVVITGNGTGVTYNPAANFNGSDTFTYTLNGGSVGTVTITVTPVDDPPTAVDDLLKVAGNSGATDVPVLDNDTDIDGGPMMIISTTQATYGSVVITGGGTGLSYMPNPGYSGPDSFTYTLNGGSTAQVTVTVDPIIVVSLGTPGRSR